MQTRHICFMARPSLITDYSQAYEDVSVIDQQGDSNEIFLFSKMVDSGKKMKILGIGCAEGKLGVSLAKMGHVVTCADISSSFLKKAKYLAAANHVGLKFLKCDVEVSIRPFNGNQYDVIFFMDVIEHLRNPASALLNIRKLLKKDGILIINTPNALSILNLAICVLRRKKIVNYFDKKNLWDLHLMRYDFDQLNKTLNFTGYEVIEVVPTGLWLPKAMDFPPFKNVSDWIARCFPFFNKNILVRCKKHAPIDVASQIRWWQKNPGRLKSLVKPVQPTGIYL
jgi:2-polyprenyl-3-methyl-5-hydroxy-6-metoxy-1,4-benzoquinol methylase